jgi:hypothetical protein
LLDGQGAEEPRDLGRTHLGGMALAVKEDVPADPADGGLLGAATAVAKALASRTRSRSLGGRGPVGLGSRTTRDVSGARGYRTHSLVWRAIVPGE